MAAAPPPDSSSGNEAPPVREPEVDALFRCLLHGDRNPVTVYNAIQEIKGMSGEVVVAQLSALIETRSAETTSRLTELIEARSAETNRKLEETNRKLEETNGKLAETNQSLAETNGRLDAVESQLRAVWGLLVPTLVAVIGVLLSAVLG